VTTSDLLCKLNLAAKRKGSLGLVIFIIDLLVERQLDRMTILSDNESLLKHDVCPRLLVSSQTLNRMISKAPNDDWVHAVERLVKKGGCSVGISVVQLLLEKKLFHIIDILLDSLINVYLAQGQGQTVADKNDKGTEIEIEIEAEEDLPPYAWQWEGETTGDWHDYSPLANRLLEEALMSGAMSCDLIQEPLGSQTSYEVDLMRFHQKNKITGGLRNVRRLHQRPPAVSAQQAFLNEVGDTGETLLLSFIKVQQVHLLKKFLHLGRGVINVNIPSSSLGVDTITPLACAIMIASEPETDEVVSLLLSMGASPNVAFKSEYQGVSTPLLLAIKKDNYELVRKLIDFGADVAQNEIIAKPPLTPYTLSTSKTPLSHTYDPSLDLQATVSSQNEYNPLFVACCNPQTVNNVKIVRLLLGLKTLPPLQLVPQSPPLIPEISTPRIVRGNTPLMAAAFYGRLDLVHLLLGIDEDTREREVDKEKGKGRIDDEEEATTIATPVFPQMPDMCDVNASNWWFWTPLHFSVCGGNEEVIRLLASIAGARDSEAAVSLSRKLSARQMAEEQYLNSSVIAALNSLPLAKSTVAPSALVPVTISAFLRKLSPGLKQNQPVHQEPGTPVSQVPQAPVLPASKEEARKKSLWARLRFL